MIKIKTTHVGSLPRSNELSDLLFKKDQKEKIDLNQFDEIVQRDVDNIVKKQIEVGIDYISDGEMSKISYATYVKDRIDGFSGESERKAPKDLDDFPSFKERIARTGGTPTYTRPCCTSELKIKDKTSLTKDINNFKQALEKNNHKDAFMNAASPGVISAFLPNKFYKNDDEYLENLSNMMKDEYEEITSNGLKLQLDCPDLALARHMTFKDLSEKEFLIRAEKQIECLNNAISNVKKFSPNFLLISLGVDTFEKDPISFFKLKSNDYFDVGRVISSLDIPTLFVMEGGYAINEIGVNTVNILKGFEE